MPDAPLRANYEQATLAAHLGLDEHQLDLLRAKSHGDRSPEETFEMSTDDPTDGYE